jgi:hypothetical protein
MRGVFPVGKGQKLPAKVKITEVIPLIDWKAVEKSPEKHVKFFKKLFKENTLVPKKERGKIGKIGIRYTETKPLIDWDLAKTNPSKFAKDMKKLLDENILIPKSKARK